MNPSWFIIFHYTDKKANEDEVLRVVADLKNKSRRIACKNRDQSIKRVLDHFLIQKCYSLMNRAI